MEIISFVIDLSAQKEILTSNNMLSLGKCCQIRMHAIPQLKKVDRWTEKRSMFGVYDNIDILGKCQRPVNWLFWVLVPIFKFVCQNEGSFLLHDSVFYFSFHKVQLWIQVSLFIVELVLYQVSSCGVPNSPQPLTICTFSTLTCTHFLTQRQ